MLAHDLPSTVAETNENLQKKSEKLQKHQKTKKSLGKPANTKIKQRKKVRKLTNSDRKSHTKIWRSYAPQFKLEVPRDQEGGVP